MRAIAIIISFALIAIISCNGPDRHPTGGEALSSTVFTIDPRKDTTLTTPGGALLKIPAGSLDADGGGEVRLEVKEAYSQDDLTRGKLATHSNSSLVSGGALYVGGAGGQAVSIRKPFSISIPAKSPQNGMMVFNGQVDDSAYVSWLDPRPLENNPAGNGLTNGKTIFEANCAACHGLANEISAPPLAWITNRRSKSWLFDYTRNSAKMLWRGDAYSCYLFNVYAKVPMTVFRSLSDDDLQSLYSYIDHASRSIDSNSVVDLKRSYDSCRNNDPKCSGTASHESVQADASTFVASSGSGDYYGFTLDKFGWYNIAQQGSPAANASAPAGQSSPAPTTDAAKSAADATTSAAASTATTSTANATSRRLQACPCWCDESAYRSADSVARHH